MRRTITAVVTAGALLAAPAADAGKPSKGCRTKACAKRVCVSKDCRARVAAKRELRRRARIIRANAGWLRRVRYCESGGDYRAVDPSGTYTGGYQFDDATWQSVGGVGRARDASPAEQDWRALVLRDRRGTSPWPVCGT